MLQDLLGYAWIIFTVLGIIALFKFIRSGTMSEQFDEDIKYLVFDKNDKNKMTPENFAKSQEVLKSQIESRERHLAEAAKNKTK